MINREIRELLPGETVTLLNGVQVVIRPVPFGKLPDFFEDIAALLKKFLEKSTIDLLTDGEALMATAFEEIVRIAGKIIGKRRPWFNTIDIADGIAIVNVIIAQNIDNARTKKNLAELLQRGRSLLPTSSSSSLAEDIASKILSGAIQPDKSDSLPEAS